MTVAMGKVICPKCGKEGDLEHHPVTPTIKAEFWMVNHGHITSSGIRMTGPCVFGSWPPAPVRGKKG